jgi:3-hydroxybutyrate dehydrogenase
MEQDLVGKNALVTGSTSGIGLDIAKHLLARGATVMLNGVFPNPDAMTEFTNNTINDLKKDYGARVMMYPIDISSEANVKILIGVTLACTKGKLDILVNNAGIQRIGSIEEQSPETFDAVMKTNLYSARSAMHYAIPEMKRLGGGSIINIGSVHSHVSSNDRSAYCAAKQGLKAITECAASELKQDGITAHLICPAFVKTPLAEQPLDELANKLEASHQIPFATGRKLAEEWRLQFQNGTWVELSDISQLVGDIAAGKSNHKSGSSIVLGEDYVKNAVDNIVTFPDFTEWALKKLEQSAQPDNVPNSIHNKGQIHPKVPKATINK